MAGPGDSTQLARSRETPNSGNEQSKGALGRKGTFRFLPHGFAGETTSQGAFRGQTTVPHKRDEICLYRQTVCLLVNKMGY